MEKIEEFVFPKKEGSAPKMPQLILTEEQWRRTKASGKPGETPPSSPLSSPSCDVSFFPTPGGKTTMTVGGLELPAVHCSNMIKMQRQSGAFMRRMGDSESHWNSLDALAVTVQTVQGRVEWRPLCAQVCSCWVSSP